MVVSAVRSAARAVVASSTAGKPRPLPVEAAVAAAPQAKMPEFQSALRAVAREAQGITMRTLDDRREADFTADDARGIVGWRASVPSTHIPSKEGAEGDKPVTSEALVPELGKCVVTLADGQANALKSDVLAAPTPQVYRSARAGMTAKRACLAKGAEA